MSQPDNRRPPRIPAEAFTPQPSHNRDDARDDACCSAMTLIKLLAVKAPIEILRKELANLTKLIEQSAGK
jgi:hypothetical protein